MIRRHVQRPPHGQQQSNQDDEELGITSTENPVDNPATMASAEMNGHDIVGRKTTRRKIQQRRRRCLTKEQCWKLVKRSKACQSLILIVSLTVVSLMLLPPLVIYDLSSSSSNNGKEAVEQIQGQHRGLLKVKHTTDTRRPKLFVCTKGATMFTHWHQVFPDYELVDRIPFLDVADADGDMVNSTKDDLVVMPMYERVCGVHMPLTPTDLLHPKWSKYRGKILWFRAEPKFWTLQTTFPHQRVANQFQMGAFEIDKYTNMTSSTKTGNTSMLRGDVSSVQEFWRRHTLQVHFLTLVILEHVYDSAQLWSWLVDTTQRRRSSLSLGSSVAYFARNCVPFRQQTASILATQLNLTVHYASGGCAVDGPNVVEVTDRPRSTYQKNYELFHDYKYCLVMENTNMEGYVTEKILNAFLGGCIPIYYGTAQIFDMFNTRAFIFWDIDDPTSAIEQIERLEHDDDAYQRMLSEPILNGGKSTIDKYLSLYPTIEDGSVNRRVRELLHLKPLLLTEYHHATIDGAVTN